MAKSRKRKSGKKRDTGQTLTIVTLIIAIGALGLGLYQFILPAAGPTIYSLSHDDIIGLDGISMIDYLSELELNYSAQAGDSVLIEFSCQIYLDPIGGMNLYLHFDINGSIFPSSSIRLYTESFLYTTGYLRYYIESSATGGENTLYIVANIDDEGTNSYVRYSLVTVTVY